MPTSQSFKMLLSKQSSKIGEFKATVFDPWIDTYSYTWESQQRTSTAWRCILVSFDDPKLYCLGEFKKTQKNRRPSIKMRRISSTERL